MPNTNIKLFLLRLIFLTTMACSIFSARFLAAADNNSQGPPPVPVRVAPVVEQMVSDQISLIGTTEAIAESTVAAEVPGVVAYFPVAAGDFVKKGSLLLRLRSTELKLSYKSAVAASEKIKANLQNAEIELNRLRVLKETNSIAETQYDNAYFSHQALEEEFKAKQAEIEQIEYELKQKTVVAPFSGFITTEHTQVGEWVPPGGPVVTMLNLERIKIAVDVPERYSVLLSPASPVSVMIKSLSDNHTSGNIYAVLAQGDPESRTFPVIINMDNPDLKIKSGMEAMVLFNLVTRKKALLVPKDAVVTAGDNRLVFVVNDGKAKSVAVEIMGYYNGDAAVEANLNPGDQVVIRGNERLRPGQPVVAKE